MKRLVFFILFLLFQPAFCCFSENNPDGIFPGSYQSSALKTSWLTNGDTGYNYRTFDKEKIRSRIQEDLRFEDIIQSAKELVAEIVSKSDEEIRALIAPADTKRAFMVHRSGCPVHGGGTGVYLPFGIKIDLSRPFQVRCPIGGEWYPNSEFPDDGGGWLDERPDSPTKGDRYYFKGWFQHWFLRAVGEYLKKMAQLWLVTGDEVYSHKAQVLLERFTGIYPDIDSNDLTYSGTDWGVYVKMTGSYWEGTTLLNVAKAVEILLPVLPENLVETVHENIYLAAFDTYRAKPAASNWGNNWNPALAKFATVTRDFEMLEFMLNEHPAAEAPVLDNQFFRDGFPYEASLSYASLYHIAAANVAEAMGGDGRWIWEHPHMKESFHSFAELVCLDRFTHFAADMGSLTNNGWTLPSERIKEAYRTYRPPELARYLIQAIDIHGDQRPVSLDDLFKEPLDMDEVRRKAAQVKPLRSTVAPVRGIAVLRSGEGDDRTALILDYGYAHSAHSHADRLNINLFTRGREFIPEMGYPEYMDGTAPATGGWTTHTVCHATVEVDEKRQNSGVFGDLNAFVDTEGIKFIDASCEDAYVHRRVGLFRRSLVLVDVPGGFYVVDMFRVRGGKKHDYLFHGPPVELELNGPVLSPPAKGTLAGEDIPFGQKPEGLRPYDIENSGYQYLYDVQKCEISEPYTAQWTMEDGVKFTSFFVPDGAETFIKTMGYPRPSTKSLPPMPFLIRRRNYTSSNAESHFISVLSVEKDRPVIHSVRKMELTDDSDPSAIALLVKHSSGEDLIFSTVSTEGTLRTSDGSFAMKGLLGKASRENGRIVRMTLIGGTVLIADDNVLYLEKPEIKASIKEVYDDRLVLDSPLPPGCAGQLLLADRGPVRSVYRIEGIEGKTVNISPSPWVSRGRVGSIDEDTAAIVDGRMIFPLGEVSHGARNYYSGAWLVPVNGAKSYCINKGGNEGFVPDSNVQFERIKEDFPVGKNFLIYDVGPGDNVRLINFRQKKNSP